MARSYKRDSRGRFKGGAGAGGGSKSPGGGGSKNISKSTKKLARAGSKIKKAAAAQNKVTRSINEQNRVINANGGKATPAQQRKLARSMRQYIRTSKKSQKAVMSATALINGAR